MRGQIDMVDRSHRSGKPGARPVDGSGKTKRKGSWRKLLICAGFIAKRASRTEATVVTKRLTDIALWPVEHQGLINR